MALDLLGQTRSYYQYIAKLSTDNLTEDDVAFLRKEHEYRNVLLVEQPNTDFAYTITRQYFFDVFHYLLLKQLQQSTDVNLVAIAKKSIKEVGYHKRFSGDWLIRLGDGTDVSHEKAQQAVDDLWMYTNELFDNSDTDKEVIKAGYGADVSSLKEAYFTELKNTLAKATLSVPEINYFQNGGKAGVHSEHMGYILADMQYMQRTYPNMKW